MSAQKAYHTPSSELFPPISPESAPRRKRMFAFAALLTAVISVLTVLILVLSPAILEAMSATVLPPQPGVVQWNGHDRITVVAMGLTQRTTEPARTDTLMVMDIDPSSHRINVLSVPRDLWVDIPGYGQGKLAIAYEVGGPKLAAYTMEKALGIPVDYTISLTFRSFMRIVDAMGGVDVNVPQELNDPTYPCLVGYDYCPIDIKPGMQHMNGATALEFVRERHAFAQQDLARVKDQQAFSDAVKRHLLSPITWPRIPNLISVVKNSLITDVPLNDLPAMAVQYLVTPKSRVDHEYINMENGMVKPSVSNDGQDILLPSDSTSIPNLVHRLFSDNTIAQESASVAVLNGSATAGAASDLESTLQGLGYHTVMAGNADRTDYKQSEVIVNTSVPGKVEYTARRLQRLMNATLVHQPLPGQSAQIEVILGSDSTSGSYS